MDLQRLKDIIEKESSIAIVVGNTYGIDEMGAALSLYLALTSFGKNVSVLSGKAPIVEVSNLVGIDQVKDRYESASGDLVVSFPYKTDEIGKVSYTLENGFLNIIVKPKDQPLSFGEKDVQFRKTGDTPKVIVAIGVKRITDLNAFFDIKDTTIINIDKPSNNENYGDVVIIGQGASSVSEQVANLLLSLNMPLDQDISQNLMSGIISVTSNFQSPKTSSLAFEMAGILLRNGARRDVVRPQVQPLPQLNQNINTNAQQQIQQQIQRARQQMRQQNVQRDSHPRDQRRNQPMNQPLQNPVNQPQPQQDLSAPDDWLAPKIFKGSTNVE